MAKKKTSLIVSENGKNEQIVVDAKTPAHVKAQSGISYLLHTEDGTAPQNVTAKRVGGDLEITLEGDDAPALVIDGFFTQTESVKLYGIGEDGLLHDYARTDGDLGGIFSLADSESQPIALGIDSHGAGAPYLVMDPGGNNYGALGLLGLLGVLGVGAAAYAYNRDNDDGNPQPQPVPVPVPDTEPPAPSANNQSLDDVGPITGPIAPGGTTDDTTPTFSGDAEPGATVVITDNGSEIGSTTVNPDGTWNFTPDTPLPEGSHEIIPTVVDPAGNQTPGDPVIIVVDTTSPDGSTGNGATDNEGEQQGPIAPGGTTDDSTPTFNGNAEPGATVVITDNGNEIGSTTVNPDGTWNFTPDTPLPEGNHEIIPTIIDPAGNSTPSDPIVIVVDTTAPSVPSIGQAIDDAGDVTGPLVNGDVTDDPTPTFNGTGEPGAIIKVYDNGGDTPLGSVTADADGNWSFTPTSGLPEGEHAITTTATDAAGNTSAPSAAFDVVTDYTAPDASQLAITGVLDDAGAVTGNVASGGATDDAQPQIQGTGTAGDTIIVSAKAGAFTSELGRATVGADGKWTLDVDAEHMLVAGSNTITAVEMDPAGNKTAPSSEYTVNFVGGNGPDAPSITSVTDDVGQVHAMQKGEVTNDATPTVLGTAEQGATVYLYDGSIDGQALGSVAVDADGNWSITPSPALADGEHNLVAVAINAVGQQSEPTGGWAFSVDTVAPDMPASNLPTDDAGDVTGPIADGDTTDDATPTFSGGGEPGATVVITDNGDEIGSTTVNPDGTWDFTPDMPLPEGSHEIIPTIVDPAGNSTPGQPINVVVDTSTQPVAIGSVSDNEGPVMGNVAPNGVTDDTTPTVSGTAKAGSLVTVMDGEVAVGSTTADANGNWSVTPDAALAEGAHTLTATAVDPAGNSQASGQFALTVDTGAPAAPTIGGADDDVGITGPLASGDVTDDPTPTFNGTGEPGAIIKVYDNGGDTPLGSVTADADGNWSFTPTSGLPEGEHAITTTATDAAGNTSAPSAAFDVVTDYTAPDASQLAITGVLDDAGAVTGNVASGGATDDAQPQIQGTGTAGDTIIVSAKAGAFTSELGRATVGADGKWTLDVDAEHMLVAGSNTITAVEMDPAGNKTAPSSEYTVNFVGGNGPDAPSITSVTDDVGQVHAMQKGEVTNDATPTVLGTAEQGATVYLYDGSIDGQALGSVAVDADGNWSITPSPALADGEHNLVAVAINAVGQQSEPTGGWAFSVDTVAPDMPASNLPTDDAGDVTGPIADGDTTDDATPTFSGGGEPGATVVITDNGDEIGSTTVNPDGTWDFTPDMPLPEGSHEIIPTIVDPAGNSTPGQPINVVVDTSTQPVAIGSVSDNEGPVMGNVAPNGVTDDTTPTVSGTAKAGSLVTVMDGEVAVGSTTADANGNWSVTPDAALAEGAHTLTATAVDPAGNSQASGQFALTVDTGAPAAPTIGGADDDVGITGPLASGDVTDDPTPTFNGTGEPGAIIKVYDNGGDTPLGSVTADADGNWSFTPTSGLPEGEHAITTTATDAAGNTSAPSAAFDVVTDYTAPTNTLDITGITDDTGLVNDDFITNDTSLTVNGTLDQALVAGDRVQVSTDGGMNWADAQVDGTAWSFADTQTLGEGDHTYMARVVDGAGNIGNVDTQVVTVDTTGPDLLNAIEIVSISDDTGTPGDFVTSDTSLTVNGTLVEALGAGERVQISTDGGSTWAAAVATGTTWSFVDPQTLSQGEHTYMARVVDTAGNIGSTDQQVVTIAGTPPTNVVDITAITDDSGTVGDYITNDTSLTVNGTLTQALATGEKVQVSVDAGSTWADADVTGTGWSFVDSRTLTDGDYTYQARVVDQAGNIGNVDTQAVTVDTTPPSPSNMVDITGITDDTGAVGDFVTSDTSLTVNGTLVEALGAGERVQISTDGGSTWAAAVATGTTWSFVDPQTLSQGEHTYMARVVDTAGNIGSTDQQVVTIDTTSITAQASLDLDTASDTGVSTSDNITNVSNPLMNGSVTGLSPADMAEINAGSVTATLFEDANNNGVMDSGETVYASDIALTANGADGARFSFALPLLQDGSYNVKSVLVDAAGNQSTVGLLDDNPAARLVIDRDQPTTGATTQPNDGLGWDLTSAGDFNGDGFEDFLVSAPHTQRGFDGGGANSDLYMIYGGENGLPQLSSVDDLTAAQGIRINNVGDGTDIGKAGININKIGDINGDGYDDVILGSHRGDSAYVLFGQASGTAEINLGDIYLNGANENGFRFGWGGAWIGDGAAGGDINGDGYADIMVTESSGNKAYVLYGNGSEAGTGTWAYNYDVRDDGLYNHQTGQKITSGAAFMNSSGNSSFGDHLNMVGDVNHDGYQDFIVTHPDQTSADGKANAGVAYLVWGSSTALPVTTAMGENYSNIGIKISGTEYGEQLGDIVHDQGGTAHGNGVFGSTNTIAELGDINGDGIADFAIGSPGWGDNVNDDGQAPGRTYVLFGSEGVWNDFSLDSLNGTNGFALTSDALGENALLGNGIRGAGDVNGDGLDDYLMGAPNADTNNLTDNGATYLIYGREGGYQANMDLEDLVASGQAKRWDGGASNDYSGTNSAVGDWNGDGLADVGISSWMSDNGAVDGGSYAIHGGEVQNLTQGFTAGDDHIVATAGLDRLSGGVGNDTLSGISLGDVGYGGAGDDTIDVLSTGFARVDGGLGIDTLLFGGAGMNVDLSTLGLKVQGFEKFDLGLGANSVTLSATDVITSGEHNLAVADGKVQMQVDGELGSTVNLSSADGWANQGMEVVDGTQYSIYTTGNAELLVEDKVHVAIL